MIGRKKEAELLNRLYNDDKAHFVAVYGRRRVGKTYLINEVFNNKITFKHSGVSLLEFKSSKMKSQLKYQLKSFYNSLIYSGMEPQKCPTNWFDAFLMLELYLKSVDDGSRQLIFIDELPWLDTPKSGFMSAFESFWNNWACSRKNLMLVVCGSATSWITDKLINNHGGLYNRLTCEIKLEPFTLKECEQYFSENDIKFSRYDITSAYMICGGIPYYLSYFYKGYSLAQNIDNLFFKKNAPLNDEFDRLFASVFANGGFMKALIKVIGNKRIGCTRKQIVEELGIDSNGMLTSALNALVSSDFIERYVPFGKKIEHYKVIDQFCNFYLKFMEESPNLSEDFWLSNISNQAIVSWKGLVFENICFSHIAQIKKALEIAGVNSEQSSWSKTYPDDSDGLQIDMIIKRNDNIINMCEIKFYGSELTIDKQMDRKIRYRISQLENETNKKFSIRSVLITTYGLANSEYNGIFSNVITLDDLFE